MKNSRLFFSAVLLFSATGLFGKDFLELDYFPSASLGAQGGSHVALAEDFTVLFTNPAGFQAVKPQISIAKLGFGFRGPLFELASLGTSLGAGDAGAGGLTAALTQPETLNLLRTLNLGIDLGGPIYAGYVGNGLGVGGLNYIDVDVINRGGTSLEALVGVQMILAGGYSFRIPLPEESGFTLDLGLTLKASIRGEAKIALSLLSLIDPNFISTFGSSLAGLGMPFDFKTALGLDLGIRWAYKDYFAMGVSILNAYAPELVTEYVPAGDTAADGTLQNFIDAVKPDATVESKYAYKTKPMLLKIGVAGDIPMGVVEPYINRVLLTMDYNLKFVYDEKNVIKYSNENAILGLSFGAQFTFFDILDVRFGVNEGLFAAGFGLDYRYFKINAAMYGTEESAEPGLAPAMNLRMDFEFKI